MTNERQPSTSFSGGQLWMYALTVRQPWADCILYHGRRIENRAWKPPQRIIGERIAIHAGKELDTYAGFRAASQAAGADLWKQVYSMRRGAVVATAVVTGSCSAESKEADSVWFTGPIGWLLDDIRILPRPVLARGYQGVWKWAYKADMV